MQCFQHSKKPGATQLQMVLMFKLYTKLLFNECKYNLIFFLLLTIIYRNDSESDDSSRKKKKKSKKRKYEKNEDLMAQFLGKLEEQVFFQKF